jgi:hypothetical protein
VVVVADEAPRPPPTRRRTAPGESPIERRKKVIGVIVVGRFVAKELQESVAGLSRAFPWARSRVRSHLSRCSFGTFGRTCFSKNG